MGPQAALMVMAGAAPGGAGLAAATGGAAGGPDGGAAHASAPVSVEKVSMSGPTRGTPEVGRGGWRGGARGGRAGPERAKWARVGLRGKAKTVMPLLARTGDRIARLAHKAGR